MVEGFSNIPAFPDGNCFVTYNAAVKRLIVGNSEGLVKVFNTDETDLEPNSIDIIENLTSITCFNDKLVVTNTAGHLELVDISQNESLGTIFRSELPLRDAIFINEGKRILCGGDENKLFIIDRENSNSVTTLPLSDQLLNLAYNPTGELVSISLADESVHVYSVINELPNFVTSINKVLKPKISTSLDKIDFEDEHEDQNRSTRTKWAQNGKFLLVPTQSNSIRIYDRSNWDDFVTELPFDDAEIIDFQVSPNEEHVSVLYTNNEVRITNLHSNKTQSTFKLNNDNVYTSLAWHQNLVFAGSTRGQVTKVSNVQYSSSTSRAEKSGIEESPRKRKNDFVKDEAEESGDSDNEKAGSDDDEGNETDDLLREFDDEEISGKTPNGRPSASHLEDSMIIDEDDDNNDNPLRYYNKGADYILDDLASRKRQKNGENGYTRRSGSKSQQSVQYAPASLDHEDITPYSCGSTPWSKLESTTTSRRYLTMNSIGYVWSVKNNTINDDGYQQQSISVSFFDRRDNKDYHFIDYSQFELCSMNEAGVVLASSGYKERDGKFGGRVYYRHHSSVADSWERQVPLLKGEHLTSISISSSLPRDPDTIIVVGTNLGYVRVFNLHGLCVNIIKTAPVVTTVSSRLSILFMINQIAHNVYTYSLIDVKQGFKFLQQDVLLPLKRASSVSTKPLLKGVFFNEYNDPCFVSGSDDTLVILESWREANNAKWIPILNCQDAITENGTNRSKKSWTCWPLGMAQNQLNCLILKNSQQYPGFPLPLPVELDLKLPLSAPVKHKKHRSRTPEDELFGDDQDDGSEETAEEKRKIAEDEAEEKFLQAVTMGRIITQTASDDVVVGEDETEKEELFGKVEAYSVQYDRSLLSLFAASCQDSRLSRAMSIVRLIRNDKALSAAAKIADRFEFINLASKINKLREKLIELEEDED